MAVKKNKEGVWYFALRVTDSLGNRKLIKKQSQSWSKRDALQAERDFLSEIEISTNMTFSELTKHFIEYKKMTVKHSTWYDIESVVKRHMFPTFENMRIDRITPQHIINFQRTLLYKTNKDKFYSNAQITKIQKYLKSIFTFAYLHDFIKRDPTRAMKYVRRDELKRSEHVIVAPHEFLEFIECVDTPQLKTLYMTLYWCGLRIGEAMALTFDDVDLIKGYLNIDKTYNFKFQEVTSPKTKNSVRIVEMPSMLIDQFKVLFDYYRTHYDHDNTSTVFGRFAYRTLTRRLDDFIVKSNVKRFSHHDLRHSCVSMLANAGFNDFQAAKRMGHDVKMFNETYGHLFPKSQTAMTKSLEDLAKI